MKRCLASIIFVAVLCVPAFAQGFRAGGNGGMFLLSGDSSDVFDNGWNVNGFGEFFFTSNACIRADLGYSQMESKYDNIDAFELYYISAGLGYHFGDQKSIHPYVTAGVGDYHSSTGIDTDIISGTTSENDLGIDFGAGLIVPFGSTVELNFQAMGHHIFYDGDDETDYSVGIGLAFSSF
jgi:hypothetical protein